MREFFGKLSTEHTLLYPCTKIFSISRPQKWL